MDWIMLLKNDGALPLSQEIKKLAFIGLFGARLGTLFGGYAYPLMLELLSTQVWVGTDSCLKPE